MTRSRWSYSRWDGTQVGITDDFFGTPYVDVDEWRDEPAPHRHIHGGFEGTDTRFRFYLPPAEQYRGRMVTPLFALFPIWIVPVPFEPVPLLARL